jgi:hypothetical protein
VGAVLLLLFGAGACAHKQTVRLDSVPKEVTIYLDQEPLDGVHDAIHLRTDRPHTLFFKGGGYEPDMVVLDVEGEGKPQTLSPRDVCAELHLVKRRRDLELEVEPQTEH